VVNGTLAAPAHMTFTRFSACQPKECVGRQGYSTLPSCGWVQHPPPQALQCAQFGTLSLLTSHDRPMVLVTSSAVLADKHTQKAMSLPTSICCR
jgi:hypothetical protein